MSAWASVLQQSNPGLVLDKDDEADVGAAPKVVQAKKKREARTPGAVMGRPPIPAVVEFVESVFCVVRDNPGISSSEICDLTQKPKETRIAINRLAVAGRIKRVGFSNLPSGELLRRGGRQGCWGVAE